MKTTICIGVAALTLVGIGFGGGTMHEDEILGGSGSVWFNMATQTLIPQSENGQVRYPANEIWQHGHEPPAGKFHVLDMVGGPQFRGNKASGSTCSMAMDDEIHIYIKKQVGNNWQIVTPNINSPGDIIMRQKHEARFAHLVPAHRQMAGLRGRPADRPQPGDLNKIDHALAPEGQKRVADKDFFWVVTISDTNYQWDWVASAIQGRMTLFYVDRNTKAKSAVHMARVAVKKKNGDLICSPGGDMPKCAWIRVRKNDGDDNVMTPALLYKGDPDGRNCPIPTGPGGQTQNN